MTRDAEKPQAKLSPRWTWRSAIVASDLPAPAKHIALTLSLHMNEIGDSCFPSLATQAKETGLTKSTVAKYLRVLEKTGWLHRERGGWKDGRNLATRYAAVFPPHMVTPGERGSAGDGLPLSARRTGGSAGDGHEYVIEYAMEDEKKITTADDADAPPPDGEPDDLDGFDPETREALHRYIAVAEYLDGADENTPVTLAREARGLSADQIDKARGKLVLRISQERGLDTAGFACRVLQDTQSGYEFSNATSERLALT